MYRLSKLVFLLGALLLLLPAAALAAGAPQLESAPLNPDFVKARAEGFSGGRIPSPVDSSRYAGVRIAPMVRTYASSFDLRTQGKVSSVKDQDPYGTCWTFSTMASMESCLLPGQKWDFSEWSLAYWHGFDFPYPNGGGNDDMATATLVRWLGPFNESQDRYRYGKHPHPATLQVQKHLQDVFSLPPRASATDNDTIKYALTTYGAISVGMYYDHACFKQTAQTSSYYSVYEQDGMENHAVTIIGWDDNYSATHFSATPPGNGAFLVKNSWGTDWGDEGYFWISYYDTRTAYGTCVVHYGAQSPANYSTVYQYDPLGKIDQISFEANQEKAWIANAFTAKTNETLSAVGLYATGPNTSYNVYAGSSLADRTLRASGTMSMGYHTIKLSKPLSLSAGKKFYVMVDITTPAGSDGKSSPIAIEYPLPGYSSKATASPGQSYVSAEGEGWFDLTKAYHSKANVCLKAYTTIKGSVAVANPVAPKLMRNKRAASFKGTIKPRHAVGAKVVRLYSYYYYKGKWVAKSVFTPPVTKALSSSSTYAMNIKLTGAGKWRFRAQYLSCVGGKSLWAKGYTYVTVK